MIQTNSLRVLLLLLATFMGLAAAHAQDNTLKFEAASLKGATIDGIKYNIFGSTPEKRVRMIQGATEVFCNEARENTLTKDVVATGNVIIKEKGGYTIYGEQLVYTKRTGEVIITGRKVRMVDKETQLETDRLYYNMNNRNARYETWGVVREKSTVLRSRKGYMNNVTKTIAFRHNVVMDDTVKNQHLQTDTLTYDTRSKIAYFHTRTLIRTTDGTVTANNGYFNTQKNETHFEGESIIENESYILYSDNVEYDEESGFSTAKNNVKLFSKSDLVTIYADEVRYSKKAAITKAYGRAMMERPLKQGDTLLLKADTLLSIRDSVKSTTTLYAYNDVKIYSADLSGICDSLVYFYNDSLIHFYQDPVLWSGRSQLTGDTIKVRMGEKQIKRMYMEGKAFILSQDTLKNYNQIKGNKVIAHFDQNSQLEKVDVEGNGQTIYFALNDPQTQTIGMNVITCASMLLNFIEDNKLKDIIFRGKQENKFVPPHEIKGPESRLPGYRMRFNERPLKKDLVVWRSHKRPAAQTSVKSVPGEE